MTTKRIKVCNPCEAKDGEETISRAVEDTLYVLAVQGEMTWAVKVDLCGMDLKEPWTVLDGLQKVSDPLRPDELEMIGARVGYKPPQENGVSVPPRLAVPIRLPKLSPDFQDPPEPRVKQTVGPPEVEAFREAEDYAQRTDQCPRCHREIRLRYRYEHWRDNEHQGNPDHHEWNLHPRATIPCKSEDRDCKFKAPDARAMGTHLSQRHGIKGKKREKG